MKFIIKFISAPPLPLQQLHTGGYLLPLALTREYVVELTAGGGQFDTRYAMFRRLYRTTIITVE